MIEVHLLNNFRLPTGARLLRAWKFSPLKSVVKSSEIYFVSATASLDTVWTMSTYANHSIAQVATAVPDSLKWHQMYIFNDRIITELVVQRAVKHGFKALVLTIDAPVVGKRRANIIHKIAFAPHITIPNLANHVSNDKPRPHRVAQPYSEGESCARTIAG